MMVRPTLATIWSLLVALRMGSFLLVVAAAAVAIHPSAIAATAAGTSSSSGASVPAGGLTAPIAAAAAAAHFGNQFVIKFMHNDTQNGVSYVSIVPVNYTNLHEPRIELRYQSNYPFVTLDERAPNNTVVAAVVVNDEDGSGPNGETSLSIEHGNELQHFKLVSTQFTNTIQVNGAPLYKHRVPEYNLTIVARDHGSPAKSSSVNLVIKLQASPNFLENNSNAPLGSLESNLKPPVTDLMYVGAMLVVVFFALIILIITGCALVQRPTSKKGPSPMRAPSAANSRIVHPNSHCMPSGLSFV